MAKEMRVYVPPELKGQVEEIAKLMNLSPTKVGQIALSLGLRQLSSLCQSETVRDRPKEKTVSQMSPKETEKVPESSKQSPSPSQPPPDLATPLQDEKQDGEDDTKQFIDRLIGGV